MSDNSLKAALQRAWAFSGAPSEELNVIAIGLMRAITLMGLLIFPVLAYLHLYLEFRPLTLGMPVFILLGGLLSTRFIPISPRIRLAIAALVFAGVGALLIVRNNDLLLVALGPLLAASHLLTLVVGFAASLCVSVIVLVLYGLLLPPDLWLAPDAWHQVYVIASWLVLMNVVLASLYRTSYVMLSALRSSNKLIQDKYELVREGLAKWSENPVDAVLKSGQSEPEQSELINFARHHPEAQNETGRDIELLSMQTLLRRLGNSLRHSFSGHSVKIELKANTAESQFYLLDAVRIVGILRNVMVSNLAHRETRAIWVTVSAHPEGSAFHRLMFKIETDGPPLNSEHERLLNGFTEKQQAPPDSVDSNLWLAGKWLAELDSKARFGVSSVGGAVIGFDVVADNVERALEKASKPTGRVLLVDDDPTVLRSIQSLLKRRFDLEFSMAQSGSEAIKILAAGQADLVITDYRMPGMDGAEFIRMVRAEKSKVPIIVITAAQQPKEHDVLWQAGADVVLSKPFSPESVTSLVERYLTTEVVVE